MHQWLSWGAHGSLIQLLYNGQLSTLPPALAIFLLHLPSLELRFYLNMGLSKCECHSRQGDNNCIPPNCKWLIVWCFFALFYHVWGSSHLFSLFWLLIHIPFGNKHSHLFCIPFQETFGGLGNNSQVFGCYLSYNQDLSSVKRLSLALECILCHSSTRNTQILFAGLKKSFKFIGLLYIFKLKSKVGRPIKSSWSSIHNSRPALILAAQKTSDL